MPAANRIEVPARESALDMEVLAQLAELMGEGLANVIRTFLSDTPSQIGSMSAATRD